MHMRTPTKAAFATSPCTWKEGQVFVGEENGTKMPLGLLNRWASTPDVPQVFQWVMCSEERLDAHRFRDIILAAVAEGRAKQFRAFKPWSARVAATQAPKDPFGRHKGKKENSSAAGSDQQLVAQIRSCSKSFCCPCLVAPLRNEHKLVACASPDMYGTDRLIGTLGLQGFGGSQERRAGSAGGQVLPRTREQGQAEGQGEGAERGGVCCRCGEAEEPARGWQGQESQVGHTHMRGVSACPL